MTFVSKSLTTHSSATEMWGYCSLKPRLPGAGHDYSEASMKTANAHRLAGTVTVLQHQPGCGDFPLRLSFNTAERYGGAIYYDSSGCSRLDMACFLLGIGPLSGSRAVVLGAHTYTHMYTHAYTHKCTHTHTYTHTRTHTHTCCIEI